MTVSIANRERDMGTRAWFRIAGYVCSLAGIITATVACMSGGTVAIERPIVLLCGAAFILIKFRQSTSVSQLKKVVLLYLVCISFNLANLQFVNVDFDDTKLRISSTLLPLAFLGVGFLFNWISNAKRDNGTNGIFFPGSILASSVLILIHMLVLFLLLKRFYGYGYEHNIDVLGSITLYILVSAFCWVIFDNLRFRQILALMFMVIYLLQMI